MMVGIRTVNRDLPPRMSRRTYKNKKGETWVGYYYITPRDENGKRKAIALGSDLNEAKRKWAELEGTAFVSPTSVSGVLDKYFLWTKAESGLSPRTIRDYADHRKYIEPVFGEMPIDKMRPEFFLRYFSGRSSKIRAKKEIKFLSTVFNWARARGLMLIPNPITGVTRQMKAPSKRTIYVTDSDFALVYQHGSDLVKDAMDIAYLTGQRPSDVLAMRWSDISDGILTVRQAKTSEVVRIAVIGELAEVLYRIRSRKLVGKTIISTSRGKPVTLGGSFKRAFDTARDLAELEAKEKGLEFNRFQFKDIRAKAATDSDSQTSAQKLLGHKNITTTTIYRRDKKEVVNPLMDKSLLSMSEKHGT